MSKMYVSRISDGNVTVISTDKEDYRLNPRNDLRDHSPTGFAWGYSGSGPAQLALAILADYADDEFALKHYQEFKRICIAALDGDKGFKLTSEVIEKHLKDMGI